METLKDHRAKKTFTLQLKNKFQALAHAENYTLTATNDINTMWEQVITAYRQTSKNRKAPRQDNLKAELFKADPDFASQVLQPLFSAIWEEKQ